MKVGKDRKTRRLVGHLERCGRHARVPTPRNHAFLHAALLTLLMVVSCSASVDAEDESQTSQPSEHHTETSSANTTADPGDSTEEESELPSRACRDDRIDYDEEILWIPESCLYQPPHEGWHPSQDEEHEWELGWWQLPSPGLDERGRVNQAGCTGESPLLDICFSICRGGLDLMGEDSPGLGEGELGPCEECGAGQYDQDWGIWYGHGRSGASPEATVCGAYYRKWNCGETIRELFLTIEVPHWEHLYIEWDETTSPRSVAGCWYRLPGPFDRRLGRHTRWGFDPETLASGYFANFERAREEGSESGEGSEESEPDEAPDSNGPNEESQPPDP